MNQGVKLRIKRIAALLFVLGLLLLAVALRAQDEPLFIVIPNNNLNLRACASTDCDIVGQTQRGVLLSVYAVEGDWYQVQVDGELVWLAGWLTTRAPDKLLETKEFYRDSKTGCNIGVTRDAGNRELVVLRADEARYQVRVNIFLPDAHSALTERLLRNGTFTDTREPYILQYYPKNYNWPNGLYRIEVVLGRITSVFGWEMDLAGQYTVHVYCGQLVPTLTPRPTRTLYPTRTPLPAPDKVLETGEFYRDRNTGCEVFVESEGFDGDLNIVLFKNRREDVVVNVYRPNQSSPLRVSDRFNDVSEDTGEPFIWQYYSVDFAWLEGLYRLEITLDGRTSLLAWRLERAGDQVIYVFCDGPAPRPTRTPRPTATRRPGPTSRPSITPRPTRTPRPTVTPPVEHTEIRTGALYRDEATGCNVLVLEFPPEQADWKDLWVIRDGELRHDFTVRVWLPDSDSPVPVEDEFDDTWDTGEPGVWQTYSPRTDWRNGIYRIEVNLGDKTSVLTWRMERAAYYQVGVSCEQQAGPAPSV